MIGLFPIACMFLPNFVFFFLWRNSESPWCLLIAILGWPSSFRLSGRLIGTVIFHWLFMLRIIPHCPSRFKVNVDVFAARVCHPRNLSLSLLIAPVCAPTEFNCSGVAPVLSSVFVRIVDIAAGPVLWLRSLVCLLGLCLPTGIIRYSFSLMPNAPRWNGD